jgi:hypothetical protein
MMYVIETGHGFDWSSEQVRTFLMGGIFSSLIFACRILWSLRERLSVLHRDIRGDDKNPGLIDIVKDNTREIQKIKLRNYKVDILDEFEHEEYSGVERRHTSRRVRDKLADTNEHEHHLPEDPT